MTYRAFACVLLLNGILGLVLAAQESRTVLDFESAADLRGWEFKQKSAVLSDQHVTHGAKSLKISANEYMVTFRPPRDWSGYDALELDVFVEGDAPVGVSLLVGDEDWQKVGKGNYWNRHNAGFNLKPGANTLSIPVNGLYRGEAGSRNNDLKYNIKPDRITRLDLGFKTKAEAAPALYLDNLRLVKESRPEGIVALDLGPASQTVFPGFTPVSPASVYGKEGFGAGFNVALPVGAARDDTFPTRLYRDAISMDWTPFIVDLPADPGNKYHVWVVYDDLGYWGGEQASFRKRQVVANGQVVFTEERGEAGLTDYLYRFEKTEPKPGDSLWDLYMGRLFEPKRFAVSGNKERKLTLKFTADGVLACRVAAIVIYPDSNKAEAEKWLAEVERRNRAEFESRAIGMGPKAKGDLAAPAEAAARGVWVGVPALEEDVTFADGPGAAAAGLARSAARGQRVSYTFAVRPLREVGGTVAVAATDLKAGAQVIPASAVDVRYVHHLTRRGFNDIAYTISPESLRPVAGADLKLSKDLTRQFWLTVTVPEGAAPGKYTGEVALTAGEVKVVLPMKIEVQPFALDEPDYIMGFYGVHVPRQVAEARGPAATLELLRTLREAGMNSFSGGPGVKFAGFDAAGKPVLDFAAVDQFMKLAREAGFSKPLVSYGGPGMVQGLHDSYVIGQTGRKWEQQTGKPFGELLGTVWGAVRDHAKEANWLPVMYELCDEPRVLEPALKHVELMKLYRRHAPWVDIGGSYSVHWGKTDPFETAVQEIFKTLNWSALNLHTQADLDKAKELGKGLHIYNQGRSRYSFGAYQWAEFHKGVAGRMQWHTLALHGYQFFDLDGREPDTAMVNWGREGVIPTVHLHRCREGVDDIRYAVTLWNLAQKQKDGAGREWIAFLEQVSRQIPLGRNTPPAGYMGDEAFRAKCAEGIRALSGGAR